MIVPFVTRWFYALGGPGRRGAAARGRLRPAALQPRRRPGRRGTACSAATCCASGSTPSWCSACTPTDEEVAALARLDRPVAVVGATVDGWASVGIDDVRRRTHRDAAPHRAGPPPDRLRRRARSRSSSTSPRRWTGSPATATRWRRPALPIDPAWEVVGDFTVRGGLAATRLLLEADPRPTAVFAASDEMAVGAVHAAREAGLRVPEDVSVIGIDDHEMAEFFELTTVAQPVHEQGQLAATPAARGPRRRPRRPRAPAGDHGADPARRPPDDGTAARRRPARRVAATGYDVARAASQVRPAVRRARRGRAPPAPAASWRRRT